MHEIVLDLKEVALVDRICVQHDLENLHVLFRHLRHHLSNRIVQEVLLEHHRLQSLVPMKGLRQGLTP
jgi:hypothetical protein